MTTQPNSNHAVHQAMNQKRGKTSAIVFFATLVGGLIYMFAQLGSDINQIGGISTATFALLITALLIALGFEFVNGFHDTANAVATVIYPHSMPPSVAVVWAGVFNFLGVLFSSGMVAFGIIALLPVELILNVGTDTGIAMVFAMLTAAIVWNFGTWYFGLPASSSHTLIGSIIGVGIANALVHGRPAIAGVDWVQVTKIGTALLVSPLVGFGLAALLMLLAKRVLRHHPELFQAPEGNCPPPKWIRGLLIMTCTGVSFAHGSNDGQKGMGLIMLILVGILPVAYGINHAISEKDVARFATTSQTTIQVLVQQNHSFNGTLPEAQKVLTEYVRTKELNAQVLPALTAQAKDIEAKLLNEKQNKIVDNQQASALRNQMYVTSESIKRLEKSSDITQQPQVLNALKDYRKSLERYTQFIPFWVKVVVALALGLGTMVGWKRIVITVGEKIGKNHLTYAQGASAEMVAMTTIGAADLFGLPVSTTHVLSSGVAGTMLANKSGLQKSTLMNIGLAWVSTLPATIALSAGLYWVFSLII